MAKDRFQFKVSTSLHHKVSDSTDGFSSIELYNNVFWGTIEGDEVFLKIEKTFDWSDGAEIKLVIDEKDYVKGKNEIVTIYGANAHQYELYIPETNPPSATYTNS